MRGKFAGLSLIAGLLTAAAPASAAVIYCTRPGFPAGCVARPVPGAGANACAAKLPKDARTIYDATLPKVTPGADLRDVVTNSTRDLAMAGSINRGSARQSATQAAQCLRLAGS